MNYGVSPERSAFLLKVTNPTLGPLRLRFATSQYQGEPSWDDASVSDASLAQVLVDELQQTHLDIDVRPDLLQDLATTETVELASSEDSFIELGGKAREVPAEIRAWEPSTGVVVEQSTMRVVVCSASTAWFELVTCGCPALANDEDGTRPGIPIALQVEVGNGSWESSLIPQQQKEDDFVTFDLLLTWP